MNRVPDLINVQSLKFVVFYIEDDIGKHGGN